MSGLRGGIDVLDTHSGRLRLRVFLPEPIAATSVDTDALDALFLTADETGQRLFVLTKSGLTIVQLASLPLAIGTVSPATGPAAAGTAVTIRGSGFASTTTATLGGQSATVAFKDANTLILTTPTLPPGPQQLVLTNPDGQTLSFDSAFTAN
jgi:IPT/TIG domain